MKPEQAFRHCRKQGRIKELEKIIINNPYYAYYYAQNIIKGRWPEAENVIATDPHWAFYYAKHVIKGKLPEHMHNAMILHNIANPKDRYVKLYWGYVKLYWDKML